jgi:hypothetical protein
MAPLSTRRCGGQIIALEAPDLLVVTLCGGVTREDIEQMLAARAEYTAGLDHFLVLCRMGDLTGISIDASRALADSPDPRPQAVAFLNASFRQRVIAGMVIRAARFFLSPMGPYHFSDTEAEAHAWLEDMRLNFSSIPPPATG